MPIEPGNLLMPQPTSSVRWAEDGGYAAQLQAFLQCIDGEIGLIARDDERGQRRMELRPAPSMSRPRSKALVDDWSRNSGARSLDC